MFNKKPLTDIEAIDRELERLHEFIRQVEDGKVASSIWARIKELENALIGIKKNELPKN